MVPASLLHAVDAILQARVPNLCRTGVTSTCRIAVQALACIDPLQQLLVAKGMQEVSAGAGGSAICDGEAQAKVQSYV